MKEPLYWLFCYFLFVQAATAQTSVLFVGNSFTHGNAEPVYSFHRAAITDANGSKQGGVPGIFKKMTERAGLSYKVTIEAVSGQTLSFHYAERSSVIGSGKWDVVVLQEYSTRPLPVDYQGSPFDFYAGASSLRTLIAAANPATRIFLYETWARPDQVFLAKSVYGKRAQGLADMQADLRSAYKRVGACYSFTGIAPVGDAFQRAVEDGVADGNPFDGITRGKINLWYKDNYHASEHGSYLAAAVLFASLTGKDPRTLDAGDGSAASELGISACDAQKLNRIAAETVKTPKFSDLTKW